jgi:hypothetical protein
MNFARGGRLAQDRSPPHPLLTPRCPPRRTLRVLQHLDAVNAQVSALGRHRASPLANAPTGGGGACGFRAVLPPWPTRCYSGARRQHRRGSAREPSQPPHSSSWKPHHHQRRVVPRLHQQAATRHFTRVRGLGLLRRAGPSDVSAVPRRRGLLVRLLRQLQRRELRPHAGVLRRARQ